MGEREHINEKTMEGVLVSAASGALKAVIVKLATLLGDEFKHMKDVRKQNRASLQGA